MQRHHLLPLKGEKEEGRERKRERAVEEAQSSSVSVVSRQHEVWGLLSARPSLCLTSAGFRTHSPSLGSASEVICSLELKNPN